MFVRRAINLDINMPLTGHYDLMRDIRRNCSIYIARCNTLPAIPVFVVSLLKAISLQIRLEKL